VDYVVDEENKVVRPHQENLTQVYYKNLTLMFWTPGYTFPEWENKKIVQEGNPQPVGPADKWDRATVVLLHGPLHAQHHQQHPGDTEAGQLRL